MKPSVSHSQCTLEPRFSLIFKGQREHACKGEFSEQLRGILKLDAPNLAQLEAQAPVLLAQHSIREKLRSVQQSLCDCGFETEIAASWAYRNLAVSQELKQRFELLQGYGLTQSFALIRIHPRPGILRLMQISARWDEYKAHVLSHGHLLLELGAPGRESTGRQLQALREEVIHALESETPEENWQCLLAFALWPEDGQQLHQLLDKLCSRLQPESSAPGLAQVPNGSYVAAGYAMNRLLQLGDCPSQHDGLSEDIAGTLQQNWPLPGLCETRPNDPQRVDKIARVLGRFSLADEERASRSSDMLLRLDQADSLPVLPQLTRQVMQLTQDADTDIDALVRVVKTDPGLSARLLSVVNSSFYGLRQVVDSIDHAVVILGFEEISQLAMALSSDSLFQGLGSEAGKRMWQHSTICADLTAGLAHKLGIADAATAYTAALLHDVGHIVMRCIAPEITQDLSTRAQRLKLPFYEIEREFFGIDHAQLGAQLLRHWSLPESICVAVEQHHGLAAASAGINTTAALIGVADHLAHESRQSDSWCHATRLRHCHAAALQSALSAAGTDITALLHGAASPRHDFANSVAA